jgi:hypothetical protein
MFPARSLSSLWCSLSWWVSSSGGSLMTEAWVLREGGPTGVPLEAAGAGAIARCRGVRTAVLNPKAQRADTGPCESHAPPFARLLSLRCPRYHRRRSEVKEGSKQDIYARGGGQIERASRRPWQSRDLPLHALY